MRHPPQDGPHGQALRRRCLLAALAAAGLPGAAMRAAAQGASASAKAGADLPAYARVEGLKGSVKATGSSTVAAVLKQATDAFEALQPGVSVDIGGAGSGTALAGMLESPATLGLLSRPMTAREREAFRAKYGHAPLELKIAVDAVAIYVFKNNPVKAMSLPELHRAFGRETDAASTWGDLGQAGDWRTVPVVRYGVERGRGAHELLRDLVLEGSDFAPELNTEPVSTSVVQGVATQPGGIGYASVFFRTTRTRVLPIEHKGQVVEPTAENALSGRYPLARYLYVVVNKPPGAALDAAQRQFLVYVLSRDGQDQVARQGLFALNGAVASESLALLTATGKP